MSKSKPSSNSPQKGAKLNNTLKRALGQTGKEQDT